MESENTPKKEMNPKKEQALEKELSPEKNINPKEKLPFEESFFRENEQIDTGEIAQYILRKVISATPKAMQSKTIELTQSQGVFLRRIYSVKESGNELKMSDLSIILGSTKSATSQAVSKLERMGLVRRKWSKADRRRVLVDLTPKGTAVTETMSKDFLEFIQTKLDKMEEDEIKLLVKIFEKHMD